MTNFERNTEVVDGYQYVFYGDDYDTDTVNKMVAYAQMAKRFMNKPFNSPLDIVGNYDWHEEFPYEEGLEFNKWGLYDKVLDFGCGPGRMINRAWNKFAISSGTPEVHGVDISEYAIAFAREHYPNSKFFVSSGIDLGGCPPNYYNHIFSTIAIQHIPVRTIRNNIFRGMHYSLVKGGTINLQVAYSPNQQAGVWSHDTEHASYESDFWNAKATNGHADMVINKESLPIFLEDLGKIFNDVDYSMISVHDKYANLNGRYHAPYWATDWLFVKGTK